MCRVYQAAADGAPQAAYALKLLLPELADDPQAIAILRREARVGREMSHPHLISVLDEHVHEPPHYLVMPWLDGASLASLLAREPLKPATAFWIARQVAMALDALDQSGWTHGDVKPDNILLSPQRHATLLDLGFATRRDEPWREGQWLLGTPAYMAPERFEATCSADIRSDIYSLGATLYEMLTGRVPFAGNNVVELIRQHRSQRVDNVRRALPHLPREAAGLVSQMLAKQPLRRPQSPAELVDQLVRLEITLLAER